MSRDSQAFTPEEDARLRKLRDQGLSRSEIADAMGRSHGSIRARVHHLRLLTVRVPAQNKSHPGRWAKYTPTEDGYLTELWLIGHQTAEIARLLTRKFGIPRSMSSVRERRIVLNLPARQAGYRPPEVLRPKKEIAAPVPQPVAVKQSVDWREEAKRRQEERARAWAHAARVRTLPPLTKAEADALVARALAAGKVTRCPVRVVAPITGGLGL